MPPGLVASVLPLVLVDHERPRWLSRAAGMEV
jgi:hypothetical protein